MSAPPLLVLGLGNLLCGDDGLGVVAVEQLARHYRIPGSVRLLDGGTLGLALLGHIDQREELLIVDAVRTPDPPGSLVRLEGDDVAPAVRERLSPHQVGVADLLDGLRLLAALPPRITLLGLVPATLELGVARSAAVERALPDLVAAVVAEVRSRGHAITAEGDDATLARDGGGRNAARALGL